MSSIFLALEPSTAAESMAAFKHVAAPRSLADRVIMVTGAGDGIGRAVARALAQAGATQRKLEATYDLITAAGDPEPALMPLDWAKAEESDLEAIAIGLRKDFRRLDALIHCAAYFTRLTPLASQTLADMDHHFRVNVTVPVALTRACWPLLRERDHSAVIFTGESHAMAPPPYWGAFAMAKRALVTAADLFAREAIAADREETRFHVVVPGPVDSPQRRQSHPADDFAALPKTTDMARAYLWLINDNRHRYLTAPPVFA
jgi:NAD(P)-dependent dehydrogenase (short-subunit alcohol dehydrogenase family)